MSNPKLFISYSWSSPTHEKWVLDLATRLRESGVDVILDKWDLKEGQDALAFMEKMVSDSEIDKVAIITDSAYAEKADGRAGGVGIETQIISKEVYDRQEQRKFVAVIAELDENGKPCLPTYYKSRVYIDMSDSDAYSENFDKLLRWIYDKPLHTKPDIGRRPAFLDEQDNALGTTAANKRAVAAVKGYERHASSAIESYLTIFAENLEKFRIKQVGDDFYEVVVKNIEDFAPYRDEAVGLFAAVAQHAPTGDNIRHLHRFFESLIPYMSSLPNMGSYREDEFDNFKFIIRELFLCWIAVLLQRERFAEADVFLREQFYVERNASRGKDPMEYYRVFDPSMVSLGNMSRRKERLSFGADLLKKRANSTALRFRHLMQADFALYVRGNMLYPNSYIWWCPVTLVYTSNFPRAFEVFARSSSKKYFEKTKQILGISQKEDLEKLVYSYPPKVSWQGSGLASGELLGYEQLATKP